MAFEFPHLGGGGNALAKKVSYRCETAAFPCQGEMQFVTVEDNRDGSDLVRRRICHSRAIVDETICPITRAGCAIEEIAASPSGVWLVTQRFSGQGEWGYDVLRSCPLARVAGTPQEYGYILDTPMFSADETRLVGGFGKNWLGGWWAHPDDEYETPARGGLISFGFLFVHHLPSHQVDRHELQMDLPKGWLPDDPEAELWFGARQIAPVAHGVRLTLPGGVTVEIEGPLPPIIQLPVPHPAGGKLLPSAVGGVKRCQTKRGS
jgi:hypothetical protein